MVRRCLTSAAMVVAIASPVAEASSVEPRILGGSTASRPYPHQAFIRISLPTGVAQCAGTLVAARYVVTAAHCVSVPGGGVVPPDRLWVGLGNQRVSAISDRYGVAAIARHPNFTLTVRRDIEVPSSDVAVLRLDRAAPYEPASMAEPGSPGAPLEPGTLATVIGWGLTEAGVPSDVLREASVTIRTDDACAAAYGALFDPRTMLCAGTGVQDACEGDSGGPLLVPSQGTSLVAGIVSWGFGCGKPGFPGVYAKAGADPLNAWLRGQFPRAAFTAAPPDPEAGQPVVLTSTSSNPAVAYTTLEWDLDGDGAFDDATGATVQASFGRGAHAVGLRASNPSGDREFARGAVEAAARTPVSFSQPSTSVVEGRSLSVPIRIAPPPLRHGAGTVAVRVGSGTAAVGADFEAADPSVIAFGPQDSGRDARLRTVDDGVDERDETVLLALGPTDGSLVPGTPSEAKATIRDNDRPPKPGYTIGRVRRNGSFLLRTKLGAAGRLTASATSPGRSRRVLAAGRIRRARPGRATLRLKLRAQARRQLRLRGRLTIVLTVRFTSAATDDSNVSRRRGRLRLAPTGR